MDALILGSSPNALSAARSLGRAGLEVVIADESVNEAVKSSRYVARFELVEAADDATFTSCIMGLARPHERPFLLATGDRYALLVAKEQQRLGSKYRFVCPSFASLEATINKATLYETARQNGVAHPKFAVVMGLNDVDAAIAAVPTPCYVKPALAHRWRGFKPGKKLERADTAADLRRILMAFIELGLVAIPLEIIPGSDADVYSVCTYIDRFGSCAGWRTKRKLRQYPLNAGDGSAQEICDEPEVAELGLRLLAIVGHRGPATVEFRRDARNGRFVLIEINARTILAQELITRSGLDVPLTAYLDAVQEPAPALRSTLPVRWIYLGLDFQAFKELHKSGSITTAQWLRSILAGRAFAYLATDDLKPFILQIAAWLARRWRRTHPSARPGSMST